MASVAMMPPMVLDVAYAMAPLRSARVLAMSELEAAVKRPTVASVARAQSNGNQTWVVEARRTTPKWAERPAYPRALIGVGPSMERTKSDVSGN